MSSSCTILSKQQYPSNCLLYSEFELQCIKTGYTSISSSKNGWQRFLEFIALEIYKNQFIEEPTLSVHWVDQKISRLQWGCMKREVEVAWPWPWGYQRTLGANPLVTGSSPDCACYVDDSDPHAPRVLLPGAPLFRLVGKCVQGSQVALGKATSAVFCSLATLGRSLNLSVFPFFIFKMEIIMYLPNEHAVSFNETALLQRA